MIVAEIVEKLNDIKKLKDKTYNMQCKTPISDDEYRYLEDILDVLDGYRDMILKLKVV